MTKLVGQVTIEGGEPAIGATVELHNASGDVLDQVVVDDGGHFAYHLAPGTWHVRAWDNRGHRGAADVVLDEGDELELGLELDGPEGAR